MVEFHHFQGDATSPLWAAARDLRWDVFVREQSVPFVLEIDARDQRASTTHLVGIEEAEAVTVARVLAEGDNRYHIGRVAVRLDRRGCGLGGATIEAALNLIAAATPPDVRATVILDAQVRAATFYQRLGFTFTARVPFMDAGIAHREMSREIAGTPN